MEKKQPSKKLNKIHVGAYKGFKQPESTKKGKKAPKKKIAKGKKA